MHVRMYSVFRNINYGRTIRFAEEASYRWNDCKLTNKQLIQNYAKHGFLIRISWQRHWLEIRIRLSIDRSDEAARYWSCSSRQTADKVGSWLLPLLLLKLLFQPFCTSKLLSVLWCQPLKSRSIEKLKNLSQKIAESLCANRLQRWPSKLFKYKHLFDDNVGPRT